MTKWDRIYKYFASINELTKTSLLRLTRQEVICAVTHNIMLNPVWMLTVLAARTMLSVFQESDKSQVDMRNARPEAELVVFIARVETR